MRRRREPGVQIKTPAQLAVMWQAGQVVAAALEAAAAAVAPGVSTAELDDIAGARIAAAGAVPSFLGYHGYPATICPLAMSSSSAVLTPGATAAAAACRAAATTWPASHMTAN